MSNFPSLEEIDSDLVTDENNNGNNTAEGDFLSREKAVLGDDADAFETPDGNTDTDAAAFEQSFPALDDQTAELNPNMTVQSSAEPYMPPQPQAPVDEVKKMSLQDSEPLKYVLFI